MVGFESRSDLEMNHLKGKLEMVGSFGALGIFCRKL